MITFPEKTEFPKYPEEKVQGEEEKRAAELGKEAQKIIESLNRFSWVPNKVPKMERKPEFERLCQELRKVGEQEGKNYEKFIKIIKETIQWEEVKWVEE